MRLKNGILSPLIKAVGENAVGIDFQFTISP